MDLSDPDWPRPEVLLDHETFRPEWGSGVQCLYWYLTFELTLGPALAFPRALTLAGGPLAVLRELQRRTRDATAAALGGPLRATGAPRAYWPHLSVGYVNRDVSADELARLRARLPGLDLPALPVDRIALASVVRESRSYRWTVRSEVPLGAAGAAQRSW